MDEATFLNFPCCKQLDQMQAQAVILGVPTVHPYGVEDTDQHLAPRAIRKESQRLSLGLDRYDFDLGGAIFAAPDFSVVDGGDIPEMFIADKEYVENIVETILDRGAVPVFLGGDHSATIPIMRGFREHGPLTVIQVDAHIDWRDEVNGVRDGYSSPMRRASELTFVDGIFQLGLRAQGSAGESEVRDALAYGAQLITAYEIHARGMDAILQRIPPRCRYYLTIDADGLDPAVMPAVAGPAAGGLWYYQVRQLIHGLAQLGTLAGMDMVEITPGRDVNGITALTAGQLILNFLGAVYHQQKRLAA
jgi:agmatinase